jgi:hypothetical protein
MVNRETKLRIARPTDNLEKITQMYISGLGFKLLGSFENHSGFSGAILGHENHLYHLEFTHHIGHKVGRARTQDNLLVFYVPNESEWLSLCRSLEGAAFEKVSSYNPYWDLNGSTFEDLDGYRIVVQKSSWVV